MPLWFLVPLFLLAACHRKDDTDSQSYASDDTPDAPSDTDLACEEAATDPIACCQPATDSLLACTDDPAPDWQIGHFSPIHPSAGQWRFTTQEDASFGVTFSGTLLATLLPDLALLGTVRLRTTGGCDAAFPGVFEVRDAETWAPKVLVGTGPLLPEARTAGGTDGQLAVTWGQSLGAPCPWRAGEGCAAFLESHPVEVSYGGGAVILYPGQEATLNGLEVWILRAERGVGEPLCEDEEGQGGGGGENWVAVAVKDMPAR